MRATYASGVAQRLQEAGVVPEAIYGTSAGGAIGAWYAAGQMDVGVATWEHANDPKLMSVRRAILRGGPMIDFRALYGEWYPNFFGMDVERIRKSAYPVFVTVTDLDTLETLHVDLRTAEDPLVMLHATSAIPLIAESPVRVGKRRLVDGGTTDPLPVAKAIADGWRDLVVIANRPPGARKPESPLAIRLLAARFPTLTEATATRHVVYDDALRLARAPPDGVRVRVVQPRRGLGVSRLTRDKAKLRAAIDEGRRDAEAILATA